MSQGILGTFYMLTTIIVVLLSSLLWPAFTAPILIPTECKEYCEEKRPSDVPVTDTFLIDCSALKSLDELTKCQDMCERNICPSEAVCKNRESVIQCSPKGDDYVEGTDDPYTSSELTLIYGGFLVGFVLVAMLVGLCIMEQLQYKQQVVQLERIVDQKLQLQQAPAPDHESFTDDDGASLGSSSSLQL